MRDKEGAMSNFKRINDFKFWCQKVLPLVYDDSLSYYEVLCKMSEYLNGVIDNVNELPAMVDEAVQNWISSGDLQKALNALLQDYNPINVKNPPEGLPAAKGDGETDDTSALQYLADYADNNNLPLFFPSGVYRASSLQIHGITMFGYNATIFKTPNTENSLINITETAALYGFELNGNIDGQNNPTSVVYVSDCKNAIISNCSIKNGTICVDAHIDNVLTLNECSFGNFTDYAVQVQGTGCLMANNLIVESVANSGALAYVNLTTFNSFISNFFSLAHIPLGFDVTGNMNKIEASIPNADNPVDDKGNFRQDFKGTDWSWDFCEGNSWHWSFCVFHDPAGLIDLMGGEKGFNTMMDSVFVMPSYLGMDSRGMIHEMREMQVMDMGQYAHGNQPIQHMVYMYNWSGQPWKTQYRVREIMKKLYSAAPDGYCGDEDNGQTSAWYVFSALGFYPVCPGTDQYIIGSPLFRKATVHLSNGKDLVLSAEDNSAENIYIKDIRVGGKKYAKTFFTHGQLENGGLISFGMTSEPDTSRGTDTSDRPYSFSDETL